MDGDRRKSDIVDAAATLFYERGYANVGMRMIAERVGVRTASLYYHYPSKEEILFAICVGEGRKFVLGQMPLIEASTRPECALYELFREHIIRSWYEREKLVVLQREERELTPEHRAIVAGYRREYRNVVSKFLQTVGPVPVSEGETKIVALSVISMVNSVNSWFVDGGDISINSVAKVVARLASDMALKSVGYFVSDTQGCATN